MNSVLEEQNLSWKAENQRLVTEVGELEAFLDDIESQSDMKSMIGGGLLHRHACIRLYLFIRDIQ
jgi:hypothetical protein